MFLNVFFASSSKVREKSFSHKYRKKLPDDMNVGDSNKYMLITAGAINPWRVDFSGNPVFYILLKGQMEFVGVPNSCRREFEQHKLGNRLKFNFC